MNEYILNYSIGVFSGISVSLIYEGYKYLNFINPLKKLWKGYLYKESYGILSCNDLVIDIDSNSTGMYDILALAEIRGLLSSFKNTSFLPYSCKNFPPNLNNTNIIVFGGPLSNNITKRIMADKNETYLKFKDHSIINTITNEIFEPEIQDDRVIKDFGIIIKTNNPFNKDKKCIVIAGCYDYGTYLASRVLVTPDNVKKILKSVKDDDFEIIVSGEILNGVPQNPEIEAEKIINKRVII
jgi:hypothetical protein